MLTKINDNLYINKDDISCIYTDIVGADPVNNGWGGYVRVMLNIKGSIIPIGQAMNLAGKEKELSEVIQFLIDKIK